ncbi:MAG: sulfotransferase [Proteobacteria bacterium]|nr:sulfotransferase [Pseudomonadota bacterium]
MTTAIPASAIPALTAAHAALSRGEFQQADAAFQQHLAATPDDPDALAEYGEFCLRTGRAASADWLLAKADALRPGQAGWLAQRGYAMLEIGDAKRARTAFDAALAINPTDAAARYGLALCHQRDGAWPQAADAFAEALAASAPADAFPILFHLAQASARAGLADAAVAHFEHAARLVPDDPALLLARTRFLRERGELERALSLLERALPNDPREPHLLLEKARCLCASGDTAQSLSVLEHLHRSSPAMPEIHEAWGECLEDAECEAHWLVAAEAWIARKEFDAAQRLLNRLLAAFPTRAAGWNLLGLLEQSRQRLAAAEAAWLKAFACDSAYLPAAAHLALLYEACNRLDEATRIAQAASNRIDGGNPQPAAIELHLVQARLARRRKDYPESLARLQRIEALAPNDAQRIHSAFERGKLHDALGETTTAMHAFTEGNRIALAAWQRQHPGRNKALAGADYMLGFVGKGSLQSWQPIPDLPAHRELAFLVGFPRSGTTLLNQVLDGHPAIHTIEEKPTAQAILDGVRCMPGGYPQALTRLDDFDIGWLRAAYDHAAARHGGAAASGLLLDKFPMNTLLAGMLHRVFPNARFVFALRHPCDVVLSCFMQNFTLNNTMANFCALADTVALYVRTMDLWQRYREALPLRVHTIRYEDVVDDFDGQVHALCDFLGVGWQDELRAFSSKALARGKIDTPSYEQVSRPIYRESRYRWQRYRRHLEPHLPLLHPWIERFGYAEEP